jgi:hypothetical protein
MNRVKQLSSTAHFNLNYETGFAVNNRQTKEYVFKQGQPNEATITWNIPFGTKVDGFMHCHYGGYRQGLNNIFSADDIIFMARALLNGYVRDTANLFFVVTNSNDYPYLLKVNNVNRFISFAKEIAGNDGNDEKKMKKFRADFNKKIDNSNSEMNTVNFLRLLEQKIGTGLLLFGTNNDITKWSKLRLTGANNDDYAGTFCDEQ